MTTPGYGEAMCASGCIGKRSDTFPWFALRVRARFEATAKQVLQGKEFETELNLALLKALSVVKLRTGPYTPSTND